jgi:multiple sugar transport system permease protein
MTQLLTRARTVPAYGLLLIWSVITLGPLYWAVMTSFKNPIDVYQGPRFLPWVDFQPTLNAWHYVLVNLGANVLIPFRNSLIVSSASAVLATFFGAMAGYGLSRFSYRLGPWRSSNDVAFFFISQKLMPAVVILVPTLVMFKFLHLLDSLPGLIIAYTNFGLPFTIWITRDFYTHIPRELEESARVDGCSLIEAFFRVVLPLAIPGIVAAFLFAFVFTWNDLLFGLTLSFQSGGTFPAAIIAQNGYLGPQYWNLAVLTVISILPSLILGSILLRYIVSGLVVGATKG